MVMKHGTAQGLAEGCGNSYLQEGLQVDVWQLYRSESVEEKLYRPSVYFEANNTEGN